MLSNRLYRIFGFLCRYGKYFGSSNLSFNLSTRSFFISTCPQTNRRLKRNYAAVGVWAALSFTTLLKFYIADDVEKYNLTLLYWTAGLTVFIAESVLRWFGAGICRTLNFSFLLYESIAGQYLIGCLTQLKL